MKSKERHEISLYWNHSHIWGFLVWHSLKSLGLPFNILTADDILKHGIDSKLLIVPGGSAKLKSRDLCKDNPHGHESIRKFVQEGGNYLGFCGGAGFALDENEALALCPWKRSAIQDRLLHHISGHLHVDCSNHAFFDTATKEEKLFPVWFPARFSKEENSKEVTILANYNKPSKDLYMADLPLASFSEDFLQESADLYGADLNPHLNGEPSTIMGNFGKGKYLLSYAHLETPDSPFANQVYFNILKDFANISSIEAKKVPSLDFDYREKNCIVWEDDYLRQIQEKLQIILNLALELKLFYPRTPWLCGWKLGLHGVQLINLRAVLTFLQGLEPNNAMINSWKEKREEFLKLFDVFYDGVIYLFYARRLSESTPDLVSVHILSDQQNRLFGKAMDMDGICNALVLKLEEVFLLHD